MPRERKRSELDGIGDTQLVMQSQRTGREVTPEDRITLFRMKYYYPTRGVSTGGIRISPMQAMFRADGPYLGKQPPPVGDLRKQNETVEGPQPLRR